MDSSFWIVWLPFEAFKWLIHIAEKMYVIINLTNGEIMMKRCCCIQMINRVGNFAILFDVEVRTDEGATFNICMSSKWFMRNFIPSNDFPTGTWAFRFEHYEVKDRIYTTATNGSNYINSIGGFIVVDWVKRGEVENQGVDQPSNGLPHNAQRVMVQSENFYHHTSKLEPMNPEAVNFITLNEYFDVNSSFEINV